MNNIPSKAESLDYNSILSRWGWAVIILCLFAVYSNTLQNGFTWDDHVVLGQETISHSPANIKYLFSREYFEFSGETTYRPVVTLSYMLDRSVWRDNLAGYHLTNVILHIIVCLLLYSWLRRRYDQALKALCITLVFGLHPVVTEPVNSIGFREDLLAALFVLLTIGYYRNIWFATKPGILKVISGLLLALAAYLSKESALVLPALLFIDYLWAGRIANKAWRTNIKRFLIVMIPTAVLAGIIVILQILLSRHYVKSVQELAMDGGSPLLFFKALAYYVRITFWPVDLYTIPPVNALPVFSDIYFIIGLVFFPVSLIAGWLFGRRQFIYLFILSWFYITLLPVSNIVPILNFVAERYMYLPLIGAAILITELIYGIPVMLERLSGRKAGYPATAVMISILLICGFLSHTRNYIWKSDISLWEYSVRQNPDGNQALYHLASSFQRLGLDDKAVAIYEHVYGLYPEDTKTANNLAGIYRKQGHYEKAIEIYRQLVKRYPDSAVLHRNLGNCYLDLDELDSAENAYKKAIELDESDCGNLNNMGLLAVKKGKLKEAENYFIKAYDCNQRSSGALLNLARLYIITGEYDKAEDILNKNKRETVDKASTVLKGVLAVRTSDREMLADAVKEWGGNAADLKKAVDEMDKLLEELVR